MCRSGSAALALSFLILVTLFFTCLQGVTNLDGSQFETHVKNVAEYAMDIIEAASKILVDEDAPGRCRRSNSVGVPRRASVLICPSSCLLSFSPQRKGASKLGLDFTLAPSSAMLLGL